MVSKLKLVVYCPEGFKYVGWQCCQVYIDGGTSGGITIHGNVTAHVVRLFNLFYVCQQIDVKADERDPPWVLSEDEKSCFIFSGESFTLDAVAELLAELFSIEVEARDGVTPL
jgi:hypothetical protein